MRYYGVYLKRDAENYILLLSCDRNNIFLQDLVFFFYPLHFLTIFFIFKYWNKYMRFDILTLIEIRKIKMVSFHYRQYVELLDNLPKDVSINVQAQLININ